MKLDGELRVTRRDRRRRGGGCDALRDLHRPFVSWKQSDAKKELPKAGAARAERRHQRVAAEDRTLPFHRGDGAGWLEVPPHAHVLWLTRGGAEPFYELGACRLEEFLRY